MAAVTELTPGLAGWLFVLIGLLLGILAAGFLLRRALARARTELALGQASNTQRGETITALRADLDHLRTSSIALDAEKGHAERQLARAESDAAGLRERLEEARVALGDKDAALRANAERLSEADRELAEMRTAYKQKLTHVEELKASFEQSRVQLKTEFQNLANQILEEKGRALATNSQASLEALLKPFREQIDGFQRRVNQVHDESLRGNVSLCAEIKRVLEIGVRMSTEANTLATALKGDKKTTGNWGEVQLELALQQAGLVRGDHYESQPRFKDVEGQPRQPDFVVTLPDRKHLVIDSKVSLVDYDRAVAASTRAECDAALDAHVKAIKNHIDELAGKDYSNLIGVHSPSFVLMFMPIEPAYIEALKHNKGLFNYGYEKSVIMVSHTTLMPILKTVANLWMVARSNEQASEISSKAAEIYNQVVLVAERLKRLGDTLGIASRHYNETVTAVAGQQGLYGKASRFSELSSKANKTMPSLDPVYKDFETHKLELVVAPAASPPADADDVARCHALS
ncbi:MAG: DNA recombination protein RmuC [Candidimonas sp.]|nr:MAG: DNA recombination protein RmuC [Candidimonas sp.]